MIRSEPVGVCGVKSCWDRVDRPRVAAWSRRQAMRTFSLSSRLLALLCSASLVPSCSNDGTDPADAAAAPTRDGGLSTDAPSKSGHGLATRSESAAIGRLNGAFSVSHEGAARYTIPLEAAPGRRGTQPNLSLAYDSSRGSSLLGVGWSLTGLSQVHRCSRDRARDGLILPVAFDDKDPLCLDGQRLVAIDGDYGQDGTFYRTEKDSFVGVEQVGDLGDYESLFTVYGSDGRTRTYGGTEDSLVLGADAPRSWALRVVRDRWDNTTTYEYDYDIETLLYGADSNTIDHRPSVIRYAGGNGEAERRVEFIYGDLPENSRALAFWFGAKTSFSKRLNRVQMYGPEDDFVREYKIGYGADYIFQSVISTITECDGQGVCKPATRFQYTPDTGVGALEVGWDGHPWSLDSGSEDYVAKAHPMDIDGDGYGDMLVEGAGEYKAYRSLGAGSPANFEPSPVNYTPPESGRIVIVDTDLDGRDDIVRIGPSGAHAWVSATSPSATEATFYPGELNAPAIGYESGTGFTLDATVADFDGDTLPDVMACHVTVPDECIAGPDPDDVCDDDPDDCEGYEPKDGCYPTTAYWRLSRGSGSQNEDTGIPCGGGCGMSGCILTASWITVDFDHDGTANLLQIDPPLPSDTDPWPSVIPETSYKAIVLGDLANQFVDTELPPDLFQRYNGQLDRQGMDRVVDVNGDGRSDILRLEPAGSPGFPSGDVVVKWGDHFLDACDGADQTFSGLVARVYYNTGKGFDRGPVFAEFDEWSDLCDEWENSFFGDWNADGRADLLFPRDTDGDLRLWVARSALPDPAALMSTGILLDDVDQKIYPMDAYGAGQIGFAMRQGVGDDGTWELLGRRTRVGLLEQVIDGYGAETVIEYEPMTRDLYKTWGCSADEPCNETPRSVVSRVEHETSLSSIPIAVEYTYSGAGFDGERRVGLGFAERSETTFRGTTPLRRVITSYDPFTYDDDFAAYPFARVPTQVVEYESIASADRHRVTVEKIDTSVFATTPVSYRVVTDNRSTRTYEFEGYCNVETLDGCASPSATDGELISQRELQIEERDAHGNATRRDLWEGAGLSFYETRTHQLEPEPWVIAHPVLVENASSGADQTRIRKYEIEYDAEWEVEREVYRSGTAQELAVEYKTDERGLRIGLKQIAGNGEEPGVLVRASSTEWDDEGVFPTAMVDGNGRRAEMIWDRGLGIATDVQDPNGIVDHVRVDGFGRRTSTWRSLGMFGPSDGAEETLEYVALPSPVPGDPPRLEIRHSVAGGASIRIQHDKFERERYRTWKGFDGADAYTQVVYAPEGWVSSASMPAYVGFPSEGSWSYDYDELGRPLEVDPPGELGPTTYAYAGRTVNVTDPRDNVWVRESDLQARPLRTVDPDGAELCTFYGAWGAPIQVDVNTGVDCQPGAIPVDYPATADAYIIKTAYGEHGWKTKIEDPNLGEREFDYNGFGELIAVGDNVTSPTEFRRDNLGRVIERSNADGVATFEYDELNGVGSYGALRGTSLSDGTTREFGYDEFGRLNRETLAVGGDKFTYGYEYDEFTRLETVHYPAGPDGLPFAVSYEYDHYGNERTAYDWATGFPYWTGEGLDASGRLTQERFGNDVVSKRTYDGQLLTSIRTGLPGGYDEVQNLAYAYDDSGNLTERLDYRGNQYETFNYDAVDRLFDYELTKDIGAIEVGYGGWTIDYGPLGNIVHRSDVGDYSYDQPGIPHALTEAGGTAYAYDDLGRQIVRGTSTLEYGAHGKIESIKENAGTGTTFTYDAEDKRVRTLAKASKTEEETIHAGGLYQRQTTATLKGSSTTHEYYIAAAGAVVAGVFRTETKTGVSSDIVYSHPDHLGSTDVVTDSSGAAQQRHSYDPFGAPRSANWVANATFENPLHWDPGFTGHDAGQYDGLTYMEGRFYDARVGRFASPDPGIPSPGTTQAYDRFAYVYNRPLNLTDPSGYNPDDGIPDAQNEAEQAAVEKGEGFSRDLVLPSNPEPIYHEMNYGLLGGDPYYQPREQYHFEESDNPDPVGIAIDIGLGYGDLIVEATKAKAEEAGIIIGSFVAFPAVVGYLGYKAYNFIPAAIDAGPGAFLLGLTPAGDAISAYDAAMAGDVRQATFHGLRAVKSTVEAVLGGRRPTCFAAGTMVATEHGLVPIEEVQTGDRVWAHDPISGEEGYRTVVQTYVREDADVLELDLDDETLTVTGEHPFWTRDRGWVSAARLLEGDELFTSAGGWVRVSGGTWVARPTTVYNFEVEGIHTYFVGDLGVLAHNGCPRRPVSNVEKTTFHRNGDISYTIKGYVVRYGKSGYAQFSKFLYKPKAGSGQKATVTIEYTGRRSADFRAANIEGKFAKKPKGYTWHHTERVFFRNGKWYGEMQLVLSEAHALFPHTGGISVFKAATGEGYK